MTPTPPSNPEETIFACALALGAAERAGYLDQACAGHAALRDRIEQLLRADDASDFMGAPVGESAANAPSAPRLEGATLERIGRYKLLQKLGEGGCGTVYMAEQEEPVRRRVALKVIKLGMDTKEVIARFEAERQVLAMMDHPNIAKVFDAGTTGSGRPFFVMELVRGVPITKFCDDRNLSTATRLELFTQVCHAVQHAHQKGIIHRDLKPSNTLVALHDDVPVPKVIDFGIAKATSGRLTNQSVFTGLEQFIGTPAYMSPEQAQLSALDVDTRSDIYSLGVLLYELLTGRTPFDTGKLLKVGLDEMRRHIREVEPFRPSTCLSNLQGEALRKTAQHRQIVPPKLIKLIRGELDWIVMRCLEKDRAYRYETANDLANDVARHLNHEPISAGPPSATYRFRKFVRRHRLAFAGAAAVAVALILGIVASAWQAVRANRAERTARSEADRANGAERAAQSEAAVASAVNDFLVSDLLRQADSRVQADDKVAPNPDLKVREALDRAGEKVGNRFESQPLTEAAVRDAIGRAYQGVGDPAKASLHHERALQLRKRTLGAEHPNTLTSMGNLALAYFAQGKLAEAAALQAQTLQIRKRVLGAEHSDTLGSMNNLASAYRSQGKFAEAAALHAETLEIKKRVFGAEHANTLTSMSNLAGAYFYQGKFAQAAALHAQVLEIRKRVLGAEHPDTLGSMSNLANDYVYQGKFAEAAALHSQVLESRKRVLGAEHPTTLSSMNNLAHAYGFQGKFADSVMLHAQTLEIQKRVLGAEHPDTLASMNNLAGGYGGQGKHAEAAALFARTLEIRTRVLGAEHPFTLTSMSNLADAQGSQGKFAESVTLQAQTLEIRKRVLGAEHPDTLRSMESLAGAYGSQGRLAESMALHAQTLEIQKRVLGAEHPDALKSMGSLADVYGLQGKRAESVALHARTLEVRKRVLGAEHPDTLTSMNRLALAYEQVKDAAKAETTYRELLESRLRNEGVDSTSVAVTRASLGGNLLAQRRFAEAELLLRATLVTHEQNLPDDWLTFNTRSLLGAVLAGQKKFGDAEPLLVSGYEGMKLREARMQPSDRVRLKDALERLVQLYTDGGPPEKAAVWREKLEAVSGGASALPEGASRK